MAEIRHLENRHDVIIFCWGWSDLDKISQTDAEWHVDCSDMVKIETRCSIWRTYCMNSMLSSRSHQPHCRVLPPGHFNVMIPELCHTVGWSYLANSMSWSQSYVTVTLHDAVTTHQANSTACHPRATYHTARCCHLVNSLSWFQSHMPHCRDQSPGEINVMLKCSSAEL